MYARLIINDLRKNRLISGTIGAFILVAAMLASLASALAVNLLGAIDNMLMEAKTPHLMQMHSGDIPMARLEGFAGAHDGVEAFQVLEFVNIEGAEIVLGGNSLAWSVQDNGFSAQSKHFDFLLGLDGGVISPSDGELYVPIYYMREGAAAIGDKARIRGLELTVAGFLRDSQMNAALVSSKRFLVSEGDFEKIKGLGTMEYLIEFRLKDGASIAAFGSEYLQAGLPANGPPVITYPIIKLLNGITDGIMIAVLVLIGMLAIVVAFLCIRFTLLAKIEEDYREIGVLKALGLKSSRIKMLYMAKYGAVAGAACTLGFLASLWAQGPFMANIRLYMGGGDRLVLDLLSGFGGSLLVFIAVVLYVSGVLRRFRKISAVQALRFGAPQEQAKPARALLLSGRWSGRLSGRWPDSANVFLGVKDLLSRSKLYATMLSVLAISSFMMNVPYNISNTISARSFMTYMGIGECDMVLGFSQTQDGDVLEAAAEVAEALSRDEGVEKHAVLVGMMFDMLADSGSAQRFMADIGDHAAFPIVYAKGRAPVEEAEIAISLMNAEELGKAIGDEITLVVGGAEKRLRVCGIYSDITNGGKTAKATFKANGGDVLWSSIPVAFSAGSASEAKIAEYRDRFPSAKISGVEEYMGQMFGPTIAAVGAVSRVSIAATALLTALVTLLFMKMLVAKDRRSIAILKSIGFSSADIRAQYVTRGAVVLALGVGLGMVLSNTLGELMGVALISAFGASTFDFVLNPLFSYLLSPALMVVCVFAATWLGTRDIPILKISGHIKEV
jgi:putative ABC transport system permease protein